MSGGPPAASTAIPMRCAATGGGRCAPACSSPPPNSSTAYLAGDAELTLYRMVLDYGEGPTEFIWPDQPRTCCGYESGCDGTAPPLSVRHWGRPDVYLSERGRYCRVCGAARYFGLLTQRRLDSGETAPLGESEPLEALPPATLTAIARDGADAVAWDLGR